MSPEKLNPKQKAFARELGIAMSEGKRDFTDAYERAGYRRHRGNAARLAANPQVWAIAEEACKQANRLAGLHMGYLQAKGMTLLEVSATSIHRQVAQCLIRDPESEVVRLKDLTDEEAAKLDAATWATSKLKIDKDGVIAIELPDKKGVIEMLARMLGSLKDETAEAITGLGDRLDRAIQRVSQA